MARSSHFGSLLGCAVLGAAAMGIAACASASPDKTVPPSATSAAPTGGMVSTIDPRIQTIADEEIARFDAASRPSARTAVVMDPRTGDLLAIVDRDMAASARISGSTMKTITIAAAIDEGSVTPSDKLFCDEGARKYPAEGNIELRDAGKHGWLDVSEILSVSSNIGVSYIFDKLPDGSLNTWLGRLHLGEPLGMPHTGPEVAPIPALAKGTFQGAVVANGHGLAISSPIQLTAAYAAIARGGEYHKPVWEKPTSMPSSDAPAAPGERVFKVSTTETVRALLRRVVESPQGTGGAARVEGVAVAGKTGTSDEELRGPGGVQRVYVSFVGMFPVDAPRFVVLVGAVVDEGPEATGGRVAAPVFARIAARITGH